MKLLLLSVFCFFQLLAHSTTYYVSPSGNDNNSGTIGSPWFTLNKAWTVIQAGDMVYMRGGTYVYPHMQYLAYKNGSAGNLIKIWNYPGEQPNITSGYAINVGIDQNLIYFEGTYFHFKGLEVSGFAQVPGQSAWAMFYCGQASNCIFEQLKVHDGQGGMVIRNSGNVQVLNSDFYNNKDPYTTIPYDGADGLVLATYNNAAGGTSVIRGCRSYWNSDDGFDLWNNDGYVLMENNWSFYNGFIAGTYNTAGNGSGYKLGITNNHQNEVLRTVRNNLGFKNRSFGMVENGAICIMQVYNNTMVQNGWGQPDGGFSYWWNNGSNATTAKNNIHYQSPGVLWSQGNAVPGVLFPGAGSVTNNSWQNGLTVTNADFQSMDSSQLLLPRQADGSLPVITFLKLAPSSDLIDAGIDVGMPYSGNAPDISAYEYNATAGNIIPTAIAGANQTITLPTNNVTLTGSGNDPDGTITAYQWTKITGPASFTIVSPAQASTVINSMVQGVYQFELRVTDNAGAFGRDTVVVTVNAAIPNQAPTANAGLNQNITLPANSVTLTGSGTDPDGTITAYQWTKITGPASFTIVSPAQASTVINSLVQGVYQFELRVTDNAGAFGRDTVVVTVNAAIPNQAPTANAGLNQNITLPANSVTLTGSGTDPDGTITAYQWTKITGPASFTIVSPAQASTVINSLVQGVYQFELRVTDNAGAFGRDTVVVTVNAAIPNQAPTANAGLNQNITLPTNSLTLNGSGNDPDGTITAYQWTKITGPACTIASPAQASTIINSMVQGIYQLELRVTDNSGAFGRDTMMVTVNVAGNQAPTANAGLNQNITLPTNSLTLNGSGIDPDGTISAYQWTKITGPACTIASPAQASTVINSMVQGVYQFQLRVTDNAGAFGRDTVVVTVNAAIPNQAPTANAGSDGTITLPINSLTLTGSGTDPDGIIISYSWTKIAGPSQFNIISLATLQTTIENLIEGTYQFQLEVTDNTGATARDVVVVTVNGAAISNNRRPASKAGKNKKVSLPGNSVLLEGSGTDPDGTITEYGWRVLTSPSQSQIRISNPRSAVTEVLDLIEGKYEFELKVTDNRGESAVDTVEVEVIKLLIPVASIFPNPVHDIMNLKIDALTVSGPSSIAVYDITGKIMYQEAFTRNQNSILKQINVSRLRSGAYIVKVISDNNSMTIKMIKQ